MADDGKYRRINKALNICAFEDYLDGQQAGLTPLAEAEQITPRVLRILGLNAGKFTLQGTNMYILGTGKSRIAVDTSNGGSAWANLVKREMGARGIEISQVLLTHWHGDHTGGVPDLIGLYPALINSIFKNEPDQGQQPITDGQVFSVDGATVRAVHAPGHSEDHMCFILEEENAMFTGDNVLGSGSSAIEDLGVFLNSLQKMQGQQCQIGYSAHGPPIADLPGKIGAEIRQKKSREKRVLQSLKSGSGSDKPKLTVSEIVDELYGANLDGQTKELALKPFMEEVLKKLAGDGKVAFEMRRRQRRWFSISGGDAEQSCGAASAAFKIDDSLQEVVI